MKHGFKPFLYLLATSMCAQATAAPRDQQRISGNIPAPLLEMQSKYKKAKTVVVDFTQKQTSVTAGSVKESSGQIFIKAPNMFRWETNAPDASTSVSNGHKAWFYRPPFRKGEKGQVLIKRASETPSRFLTDLFTGAADLRKNFTVKGLDELSFELTPLKPLADIDHIQLFLEKLTNLVYKLILFTSLGNQTELTLKNQKLGSKIEDRIFNFTPPPNTEEIH